MPLTQEERNNIIKSAIEKTKQEFAEEVASRTSLTTNEVLALAKTRAERETLSKVLAVVANASVSNKKKAAAVNNIAGGVEALVKIVKYVI